MVNGKCLKGWFCHLNKCKTSPVYILHQINEKKKRLPLHLPYLILPYALPLLKKAFASNPRPFYKTNCVYENYNRKTKTSQLSNCVIYGNAQILIPQFQNYYSLYWKMKSSKPSCSINIRLFSKIFYKNRFHLLI